MADDNKQDQLDSPAATDGEISESLSFTATSVTRRKMGILVIKKVSRWANRLAGRLRAIARRHELNVGEPTYWEGMVHIEVSLVQLQIDTPDLKQEFQRRLSKMLEELSSGARSIIAEEGMPHKAVVKVLHAMNVDPELVNMIGVPGHPEIPPIPLNKFHLTKPSVEEKHEKLNAPITAADVPESFYTLEGNLRVHCESVTKKRVGTILRALVKKRGSTRFTDYDLIEETD